MPPLTTILSLLAAALGWVFRGIDDPQFPHPRNLHRVLPQGRYRTP
jgi:hypothetical protein